MANKTLPILRQKVFHTLGSGAVLNHPPSDDNPLGQSGVHTFIDDVITIVLESVNEAEAYKLLYQYLDAKPEDDERGTLAYWKRPLDSSSFRNPRHNVNKKYVIIERSNATGEDDNENYSLYSPVAEADTIEELKPQNMMDMERLVTREEFYAIPTAPIQKYWY